jgi:hypothetical protein
MTCHCVNLPLNQSTSYFSEKRGLKFNLSIGAMTSVLLTCFIIPVIHDFVRDLSDMTLRQLAP